MKIPPVFIPVFLIAALLLSVVWGVKQCSDSSVNREMLRKSQYEKDSIRLVAETRLAQALLAQKESQQAQAEKKATRDEMDRSQRDATTRLLIGLMNRPQQDITALRYLIENGLLSKSRYADTLQVVVPKDSAYVAAVAGQGKILADTRTTLVEVNAVLRSSQQQTSDLEILLNNTDYGITNTRSTIQDYVAEPGLFRGRSRKQHRRIDRQLGDIQQKLRDKP